MLRHDQLDADLALVLVIDLQEKLLPLIREARTVVRRTRTLLDGARVFDLPVLVTEQYPRGLGRTDGALREALEASNARFLEKPTFSAWADEGVRSALLSLDRTQVIVAGIETHVCVQQTALDLVSRDYNVCICADAAGSRGRVDHETGLDRMRQAGISVTTVESVLFELCQRCDTRKFKEMLEIIKRDPPVEA